MPGRAGEGDPPVPGGPAADLVLSQAGQGLAGGEVLFCAPADPRHAHQRSQRRGPRGIAAVERQLPGVPVAADQDPVVPGAAGLDGDPGPVVPAVALGTFAG